MGRAGRRKIFREPPRNDGGANTASTEFACRPFARFSRHDPAKPILEYLL
jgi:hypothetical protein